MFENNYHVCLTLVIFVHKGPFIFYEHGGGWWDLGGATRKKMVLKGGGGGLPKKIE